MSLSLTWFYKFSEAESGMVVANVCADGGGKIFHARWKSSRDLLCDTEAVVNSTILHIFLKG